MAHQSPLFIQANWLTLVMVGYTIKKLVSTISTISYKEAINITNNMPKMLQFKNKTKKWNMMHLLIKNLANNNKFNTKRNIK